MRQESLLLALALSALTATGCDDGGGEGERVDAGPDAGKDGGLDATTADAAAAADSALGQKVTIRFKAKMGAQDLVCGQTYPNVGSSLVSAEVQDFRLFVQEVRLINGKGQEVPLLLEERGAQQSKEVALLDFTDGTGACTSGAATTNMIITGHVPADTYNGIVFVNGVSESLNHGNPALAPEPLKAPGAHWDWKLGYRFTMAELLPVASHQLDGGAHDGGAQGGAHGSDAGGGDGGAPSHGGGGEGAVFVHTGSTACNGVPGGDGGVSCSKANRAEIRFTSFNPATQSIVADLAAVFSEVDLSQGTQCHGSGESCRSGYSALGVDLTTGAPSPATQKVYRVE